MLEKLMLEQQCIVEVVIKVLIEFEKVVWDKEIEKIRLVVVKDFNVEFYEIDKKFFQKVVQFIYDGLKNKLWFYGLY